MDKYLQSGEIVNIHGIKGEVKILPWTDSADFFCDIPRVYIDSEPYDILSARVQKGCAIVRLEGVDDADKANLLRGKTVFADRADIDLPEDRFFISDIIGARAIDAESGAPLGMVKDVLDLPGHNVYVISGEREILVPDADEFVVEVNPEEGYIKLKLIEGM